ncbi:MAG: GH3 auxin-responsive promoter family protein, partial [bacterium]|nr:GH3 auxin-responsive promoter family protein [bacterium]
ESLETALKEENITYAIFRNQHILHPCHVTLMRPGWQASLYETHRKPGQTTAQIKLPILMRTQPDQAFCLSSSS